MRELFFKNITSGDKKRKDLYVSETVNKNGVIATTQKHSTYIIGGCNKFKNLEELVGRGFIPIVPKDPFGGGYYWDKETERVKSGFDPPPASGRPPSGNSCPSCEKSGS